MTLSTRCFWPYALAALAVAMTGLLNMVDAQQSPTEASATNDIEHLTRGPLHEAFAEPTNQNPAPGITAGRTPPERIDEVPPEVKPAGDDVEWIPGYWHWDDERLDFIWVSGVWRKIPPGKNWVPGYWAEVDGTYQWVSGSWVASDSDPGGYLPYPPESLEAGPSSIAAADDNFWVPGCWLYQTGSYSWRPGYWTKTHDNWVWIPAYYIWTPRGCNYVDGYWDYPFSHRGVLFCPVHFHAYDSHRIHYSPHVTLNSSGIFFHLFVRSGCNHYYFGDYYGPRHGGHQYYPWFDFHRVGRRYDPFHAHFEAKHRHGGTDCTGRYRGWHQYFADGADRRPPRTFAAQHGFEARHKSSPHVANTVLARKLSEVTADVNSKQRFLHLGEQHRRNLSRRVKEVQQLGSQRTKLEAQSNPKPVVAGLLKPRGNAVPQIRLAGPFNDMLPEPWATREKSHEQAKQPSFRLRSDASNRDAIDRSNATRLRAESPRLTTTTDSRTKANDRRPIVAAETFQRDLRTRHTSAVPPQLSSRLDDAGARLRKHVGDLRSPNIELRSRMDYPPKTSLGPDISRRPANSPGRKAESSFARTKPPFARSAANHSGAATTTRPNSKQRISSAARPIVTPPKHSARAMPRTDFRQTRIAPEAKPSHRPASLAGKGQASSRARSITSGRSNTARPMHSRSRPSARGGRDRPDDK